MDGIKIIREEEDVPKNTPGFVQPSAPPPQHYFVYHEPQAVPVYIAPPPPPSNQFYVSNQLSLENNINHDAKEITKTVCDGANTLCVTCWSGLVNIISVCFSGVYYFFAKIFGAIGNCFSTMHIKDEYEGGFVVCLIIFLCMISIFFGVFFGIVKKDMDHVDTNLETTCQYFSNIVTDYPCCDKVNCQCSEANYGSPSCSASLGNLKSADICGDGYSCCKTQCQTCTGFTSVAYSCNCNTKGQCSTCYRQEAYTYSCKCDTCVQSVQNRLCSVQCGTCYNIQTIYGYNITTNIVTQTLTKKCGKNDLVCKNGWISQHPTNAVTKCWYNAKYPNDGASFEKPEYEYNKAGLPVSIIFGCFAALALLAMISVIECSCHNKETQ